MTSSENVNKMANKREDTIDKIVCTSQVKKRPKKAKLQNKVNYQNKTIDETGVPKIVFEKAFCQ